MKINRIFTVITVLSQMLIATISSPLAVNAVDVNDCDVIKNDMLQASVNNDKNQIEYLCFQLRTVEGEIGNSEDNDKNLLYQNFYSGYTTISVNGKYYVYGTGEDVISPYVDTKRNAHISSQKFGDLVVEQTLEFTNGFSQNYDDMLKASYKIKNGAENSNVGIRVMLDPMLDNTDVVNLNIEDVKLNNEITFAKDVMTDTWKLDGDSVNMSAYGMIPDNAKPDSFTFANWSSLYDNRWEYNVNVDETVNDGAVAFLWNEKTVKANDTVEYSVMYGVKNTTVVNDIEPTDAPSKPEVSTSVGTNATNPTSVTNPTNATKPTGATQSTQKSTEPATNSNSVISNISTGYTTPVLVICMCFVSAMIAVIFYRKRRCER